jgi:LmbE family N-acetylglucosaminyl deacetylase
MSERPEPDPEEQADSEIPTDLPIGDDVLPNEERTETAPTPKRVLVIQAHPDDVEFGSSGTIARWASEGAEIHYCSITSGDKGSADPEMTGVALAATREREQRAACDILGVKSVIFLGYLDATLVPDLNLRRELTRVIRRVKPDVLMCMDPTMRYTGKGYINHPDHVAAGEASLAAVFPSARDRMTFPELLDEGLEPHKVAEVYLFAGEHGDIWVDISGHMETKLAALKAHASQVAHWDPTEMIQTWARETTKRHPDKPADFGEFSESFKYFKLD